VSTLISDGRYYGQVRRLRTVGDVVLCETAYPAEALVPWHAHASPLVCLVLRGALDEHASRPRTIEQGTLWFHPAHEPHAHRFGTATRCFSVTLGSALLRRLERAEALQLPGPTDLPAGRAAWLARQLYAEFERNDISGLAVEGLVLAVIGELTRRPRPRACRSAWIDTVRELIDARYREPLSLNDLGEAVGVHPVHVARTFRHAFGCTVGAYLRRRRIDDACRALIASEASLASIALGAGFADQSHFSRRFKEIIGLTPGEFRARGARSRHAAPD
jgi:AraC family transcriptional regulator